MLAQPAIQLGIGEPIHCLDLVELPAHLGPQIPYRIVVRKHAFSHRLDLRVHRLDQDAALPIALGEIVDALAEIVDALAETVDALAETVDPMGQIANTLVGLSKPSVELLKPEIDLLEPPVDLLEPAVDLLESLVDLLESTVDLLEPLVDLRCGGPGGQAPRVRPGEPTAWPVSSCSTPGD